MKDKTHMVFANSIPYPTDEDFMACSDAIIQAVGGSFAEYKAKMETLQMLVEYMQERIAVYENNPDE